MWITCDLHKFLPMSAEDRNNDQGHRRMVINVNVMGEEEFTFVVQGRDTVLSVLKLVESRTGISPWQQKISYSGENQNQTHCNSHVK